MTSWSEGTPSSRKGGGSEPEPDVQAQIDAACAKAVDAVCGEMLAKIERLEAEIAAALAEENEDLDAAVTRERERVVGIFVVELQKLHEKTVLDCGDNSCLFATRRGGMRTNGGCRCIERLLDAAVAREREAQSVDAAAFRLLRDEADAADAWHAETGMKVARPPRMSPATVKHIRDAEIRARSGAKGE